MHASVYMCACNDIKSGLEKRDPERKARLLTVSMKGEALLSLCSTAEIQREGHRNRDRRERERERGGGGGGEGTLQGKMGR